MATNHSVAARDFGRAGSLLPITLFRSRCFSSCTRNIAGLRMAGGDVRGIDPGVWRDARDVGVEYLACGVRCRRRPESDHGRAFRVANGRRHHPDDARWRCGCLSRCAGADQSVICCRKIAARSRSPRNSYGRLMDSLSVWTKRSQDPLLFRGGFAGVIIAVSREGRIGLGEPGARRRCSDIRARN